MQNLDKPHSTEPQASPLHLVLDTNIVLDWLIFNDPRIQHVLPLIQSKLVQLFASASTLAELERVLNYKNLALSPVQQQTHFAHYQSQVQVIDCPDNLPHLPLCRDPDDQKFLALAASCQATALLSKDKRLLELDRPSMQRRYSLGFKITLPEAWHYPSTLDNPKSKPGDFPA